MTTSQDVVIENVKDGTHLDIYKQKASHHGQDSTNDRLATPALPRLPLL